MKNTRQVPQIWTILAGMVALLGSFPATQAAVFDFSPPWRDMLVTLNGSTVFYRVYDPVKARYVSQDETTGAVMNLESKDGVLYWTDGTRVFCRIYDSLAGQWKKTNVVAGGASSLTSANGIISWISAGFVYLAVYDASRGDWIGTRVAFTGTPSGLMTRDGIVVWLNQSAAFYVAYDPILGRWEGDLQSSGIPPVGLNIRDGVVSWHNGVTVYCRVYDPILGQWKGKAVDSGSVANLQSGGGAVAWTSASTVFYNIYDPSRGAWKSGNKNDSFTTNLTVSAGTVRWTAGVPGSDDFIRGYDVEAGTWGSLITTPLAFFAASATTGEVPLPVYFIDMSIGVVGWCWNFGGDQTTTRRSPFRVFPDAGSTSVILTVTDPIERNDSQTSNINSGSPETGPTLEGASLASAQIIGPVTDTFHTAIKGFPGQIITIEQSSSPGPTWSPLATVTNTTGTVEFLDAATGGAGQRYYRVMVQTTAQ